MKVLLYLLFCGLSIHSQNNALVIFSESGHPFHLSVNNESINKIPQSNIKVFNLATGWNLIEIKLPITNQELRYTDSILLNSKSKFINKEFTYVLIEKDKQLELQFKSVSELSGPASPPVPEAPKEEVPLVDNSIYGNLYQAVNNKPVFYKNYDKETNTCKSDLTDKDIKYALNLFKKANDNEAAYRYLTNIIDNNCYNTLQLKELLESTPIDMDKLNSAKKAYLHITDQQNVNTLLTVFKYPAMKESYISFLKEQADIVKQKNMNCQVPVSDSKFEELYAKVKKAPYENDKLIVSKKLLVDVCLSSSQILKLCDQFTHDREKLELIKSACNVLTDKANANTLTDAFLFKETKDEFLKYISQ